MKKVIVSILFIFVAIISWGYYEYRVDLEKYQYWYEILDKNKKPDNISYQEYIDKNREGFCWRDNTYYTKEELKEKAMVSLIEKELEIVELFNQDKAINAVQEEVLAETARYCKRKYCGVWYSPIKFPEKEIKNILYEDRVYLKEFPSPKITESFHPIKIEKAEDLKKYFRQYGSEHYVVFIVKYISHELFNSDYSDVIDENEFESNDRKNNILIKRVDYLPEHIGGMPKGANYKIHGIGYRLLKTKYLEYYPSNRENEPLSLYENSRTYLLSNCGDVLYSPFYVYDWRKSKRWKITIPN
ncbi:hypothetical protein [Glaesserella sp.]|uniref:hypothetical protein n=1 Tax=Glaesserella sp. TaxID=2094731 RepID=UPI0035A15772